MTLRFLKFLVESTIVTRKNDVEDSILQEAVCGHCLESWFEKEYGDFLLLESKKTPLQQSIETRANKAKNYATKRAEKGKEERLRKEYHGKIDKVYGEKTTPEVRKDIKQAFPEKFKDHDTIFDDKDLSDYADKVIKEHLSKSKEDQEKDVNAAYARRNKAGFMQGKGGYTHLVPNEKNDTANDVEYKGKKNKIAGMSGASGLFHYIHHDIRGNNVSTPVTTCKHGTCACAGVGKGRGKEGSCLAMSGQGGQATTRARRAHYEQGAIDPRTRRDHILTLYHELHRMKHDAHAEGKNAFVRLDNYSEHNTKRYMDMIRKHVNRKEFDDKGKEIAPLMHYNYTKDPNRKNNPANHEHYIFSDTGPAVHAETETDPKTGKEKKVRRWNKESKRLNANRVKATTESEDNPHPMNQYSVVNLRRPNEEDKKTGTSDAVKWENFQKGLKTWRHWHHEPAKEHEDDDKSGNVVHATYSKEEEKQGLGKEGERKGHGYQYVTHPDGKRKKYEFQDHTVIKEKNGDLPSSDARFAESGAGKTRNKENKKVGGVVVSSTVKSTSSEKAGKSGMFHDADNLDYDGSKHGEAGVFHVNHPSTQHEANENINVPKPKKAKPADPEKEKGEKQGKSGETFAERIMKRAISPKMRMKTIASKTSDKVKSALAKKAEKAKELSQKSPYAGSLWSETGRKYDKDGNPIK